MKRILILTALLSLMAAVPAHALPGFEVGARGMYWFPDLSGTVKTTDPVIGGTEFNVTDDLGVGDENIPSGEIFLRAGRVHFRVGYTPVKFDGNRQLSREIRFGNQIFNVNDNVISHLDLKMIDGEVQFDLLQPNVAAVAFNLGLIAKVKYVDGNVELRNSTNTETRDFKAPIPMVGVAAGVGFLKNMVRADARVAGIAYSGNHLFEGDVYASFAPVPFFRVQGGYRLIDFKIDEDDILAKLKLKGPYIGAQLSF
jgi:outer membrane protein